MTKPTAKRKGIVVTVWDEPGTKYCVIRVRRGQVPATVCANALVHAGMRPLKPGESRKVRVTVEDEK
jgi:hypothetical protein